MVFKSTCFSDLMQICNVCGPTWAPVGIILGHLEHFWNLIGGLLTRMGASWGPFGVLLGPIMGIMFTS